MYYHGDALANQIDGYKQNRSGIAFQIFSSAIAWRECESAFTPDYTKYRRAMYNDDRLWERSLYTVAIQHIK